RLALRGREAEDDIRERLERAPQIDLQPDLLLENVGPPAECGTRLADFIAAHAPA
ncbi:MAG: phosphonate metabolism protein PhnN, partial [Rhizobiales bacterium 39-66-18]